MTDDLSPAPGGRVSEFVEPAATDGSPLRPTPLPGKRPGQRRRFGPRLRKPEREAVVRVLDLVERAAEDHLPAVDQGHPVGHPLDLVQQVRREDYGPALVRNGAD